TALQAPQGRGQQRGEAFALGPNATDDWTRPLAWIDHALARLAEIERANPRAKDQIRQARHAYLNTRGAVLYRAGRFEESAKVLREEMSLHPNGGRSTTGCSSPSPNTGSTTRRPRPGREGRRRGPGPTRPGPRPRSNNWPRSWVTPCRPRAS